VTRYEIKLVCEEAAHADVLAGLRLLPSALRTPYPARLVQSIYFDTHERDALEDNRAGMSQRQKLRLRWYGAATTAVRAQMECKWRSNDVRGKDVCALSEPVDVAGRTRVDFRRGLVQKLPPAWRERLCRREVAQWVRYRRDYLATADGRLRVTLDRDLQAFDLRDRFVLSDAQPTPLPRLLVVEVKAALDERAALEAWLQGLRLPTGRCSKFVLASSPADGPLPSYWGS